MLVETPPGCSTLPVLVEYVRTAPPSLRVERLEFAASEAARTVTLGGFSRVSAIIALTLAAEQAALGRAHAEAILAAAFYPGGAR